MGSGYDDLCTWLILFFQASSVSLKDYRIALVCNTSSSSAGMLLMSDGILAVRLL